MTKSIVDSKLCCNCNVEITLAKQSCPHCWSDNPWKPEYGIKPYMSVMTIYKLFIYPLLFPFVYMYEVGFKPILPITGEILVLNFVILFVTIIFMTKSFDIGKSLSNLNMIVMILFTMAHINIWSFTFAPRYIMVMLFADVYFLYAIAKKFHGLEVKYFQQINRNK